MTSLVKLFTCQFKDLHPVVQKNLRRNVKMAAAEDVMKLCKEGRALTKYCMQIMEKHCLRSKHRTFKTIRLSMDLVEILLHLLPDLKVIHLVRDPRGMTNSRLHGPFPMAHENIYNHSVDTCSRIYNDMTISNYLRQLYPNRITTVLYEALAERPYDGAEFIYKFLNIEITWPVIYWVFNSTHAQTQSDTNSTYFNTARTNAVASAYKWRTVMKFVTVDMLDRICVMTNSLLGFLPMQSEEILRNFNFPSRESVKNFAGFV